MCGAGHGHGTSARGDLPPLLFINADPGAFTRPPTPQLAAELSTPLPYRCVLEFTERALDFNPTGLLEVTQMVHRLGNALALDDVGVEPLSLAFLPLLEPEVVKLDMSVLRNPHSARSITTVARVAAYAERTGATVIAEGIETEQDRRTAVALGARWGQGWLFGRPGPLTALAGQPIDAAASLRPAAERQSGDGSSSLFTAAAHGRTIRRADMTLVAAYADRLLRDLAGVSDHGVLLATDTDTSRIDSWLPGYASTASQVCYNARIAPAATADLLALDEGAVVTVSPDTCAALAFRRDASDEVEFVSVHDRPTVLRLARQLLNRLGPGLVTTAGGRTARDTKDAPGANDDLREVGESLLLPLA